MPASEEWRRKAVVLTAMFVTATMSVTTTAVCQYRTPRPSFTKDEVLRIPPQRIKDYADALHFVATLGPSDLRHVDLEQDKGDTIKGALVWIQPESGSYQLSSEELRDGRIIARIWSDYRYEPLGLEPGWTWWWVGQLRGTLRSVFISESRGTRTERPVELVQHYDGLRWDQAIARFVLGSLGTWNTCGGACCKS